MQFRNRELRFPSRGLSTDDSYANQPDGTTRDTQNMRLISPEHGRDRGAQRSGTQKYMDPAFQIATDLPVRVITSLTSDNKQVDYTETATPAVNWDQITPSLRDTPNLKSDRQSNVYAIDGDSSLVKYNSSGREVWKLNLPAADAANRVRALAVDDNDVVYAGVSEGGKAEEARGWAYFQNFDGKPEKLWEVESGAFWEDLAIGPGEDLLYTIQNDTKNWKSWLRVYGAIDTSLPVLAWEREIPYPSNALAVKDDGSCLVASESFADRGQNPFAGGEATAISEDWTPEDLDSASQRIWAWLDAKTIEDDAPTIEDQDELLRWRDRSGNGRDVFASAGTGPKYVSRSAGAEPAVRFNGTDTEMFGQSGDSVLANTAASQKTLLPGYDDAGYVLCMAVRAPEGANYKSILSRWRSHLAGAASPARDLHMFSNSLEQYAFPPTPTSGKVFCRIEGTGSGTPNGAGTNAMPEVGDHANDSNIAIISLVYDANSGGVTDGALWRVNGDPIDRFDSDDVSSTLPTWLGVGRTNLSALEGAATSFFDGDILEMVVLRDYTPTGGSRTIIDAPTYPDAATAPGTTELEQLEGYLAHRWGKSHELDDGDPSISATTANDPWPHPHELENGPPTTGTVSLIAKLNHTGTILSKFSSTNEPLWVITDIDQNPDIVQDEVGGIGYGVAVDSNGDVFSVGPQTTNDTTVIRKVIDKGDSFSLALTEGAWAASYASNEDQEYKFPRLAVDVFDNLYVPKDATTSTIGLLVYEGVSTTGAGVLDYSITFDDDQRGRAVAIDRNVPDYQEDVVGGDPVERPEYVYVGTENGGGDGATGAITVTAVAIPDGDTFDLSDGLTTLTFEFDTSNDGVGGGNERIFNSGSVDTGDVAFAITTAINVSALGLTADQFPVLDGPTVRITNSVGGTAGNVLITTNLTTPADLEVAGMSGGSDAARVNTVFRIRSVDRETTTRATRLFSHLAVANGNIRGFQRTGVFDPISGGTGALNITSPFIATAEVDGNVFFADGISRNYKVFTKPTSGVREGTVVDFEATSGGRLEPACALLASWQGRLVAARSPSFPANIFMSAQQDPYDFNYFLPTPRASMAWEGNVRDTAGEAPHVITGLISWDDDTLVIGTESSIEVLRGNPVDGGNIDQLSQITGMAFGRAFDRDDENLLYFKSNKRGIMVITPDGRVRPLSRDRIERELSDIDLDEFNVELVWNYRDEGLHVFQFPRRSHTDGDELKSWFWEKKSDSWWRDDWSDPNTNKPTAAFVLDGDLPADRVMVLGRQDGHIVEWDELSVNDDGSPIESSFLYGPILASDHGASVAINRLMMSLAEDLGGCHYDVFATDDPTRLGQPVWSGELHAGRNQWSHARARGAYIYIRFRNAALNESWAMEHGVIQVADSGILRVRQ